MGSIYKRYSVYWLKYSQHGRVVRETAGTSKLSVAKRMLRLREGDVEKGITITPTVGRVTFFEAAADLLTDYEINGRRSYANAKRKIDLHLMPAFGNRRLASITTDQIRAFIAKRLAAGARNGEVNRELAALKRMYSLAIQANKLHTRPHIPMLSEADAVRTGFFEDEQVQSVIRHLPVPLRPVIRFAHLTGWRVTSEVLPLQWRQVDLTRGVVRLEPGTTKNREGRVLPYGRDLSALADLLQAQRAETSHVERNSGTIVPWIFHRGGKPIRDFRGSWAAACKAAGCPGRIPHDLRRTAVRNLTRAGLPERVAMQITGHKTRSVFDRYDICNEADLQDGLRKLGRALAGNAG